MKVPVHFFSHLRDAAGTSESTADLPEGASVADLLNVLYGRHPKLREWTAASSSVPVSSSSPATIF